MLEINQWWGRLLGVTDTPEQKSVKSFESATAEVLAQEFPKTERATLYSLGVLFLAFLVFISLARVERVVTAQGRLVPTSGAIIVQPLQTQIINRVVVAVGDVVHKGQVLAECDPTLSKADQVASQQQVAALDSEIRRREAESRGVAFQIKPDNSNDVLQAQILAQRKSEYESGVSDFDHRLLSTESLVTGLRQAQNEIAGELKTLTNMESMHGALAKEGYVSQLQLMNVQNQVSELRQKLSDNQSLLASNLQSINSLREQRQVFVTKWRDDNLTALATDRENLQLATQTLAKADKLNDLVNLVSPADAIVTRVPVLSSGGIAGGAQPLFSLVPLHDGLTAQVQIDSQDIGFVKVGDPVVLKFDAFKYIEHGVGHGKVLSISQNSFATSANEGGNSSSPAADPKYPSFYDAKIQIVKLDFHDLPASSHLIPGMTLTADIVVGKRTILWYIVGGGMRTGSEAMREP